MRTRKLKIAMLSVHSCPIGQLGGKDTGGMNVYVRELAHELGRKGHSVEVYTRAHDSTHDQVVELSKNARLIHLKAGEEEEMHKLTLYPHLSDFACSLENFRKSEGLQYDLIHSHYWLSGWVGKWLQSWWRVPHIIMFHTLGRVKNAIGIGEDETELRIETEKELVRDSHLIVVATEKGKKELVYFYNASPENVSVIPCGVNLELFKPKNKQIARQYLGLGSKSTILFVGRIEPLKGIDNLLMALPYLKKEQGLKLLIIGGDDQSQLEMERLKELAQNLYIHDLVVFLGPVKQKELPWFYSAADVCVIPSYYESFGLVALESLACGTPVVGTKTGCLEQIIRQGETGYVVGDNFPHHLAEKINSLLSNPKDIELVRASVIELSWSNIAEMVTQEYRKLLKNYSAQH